MARRRPKLTLLPFPPPGKKADLYGIRIVPMSAEYFGRGASVRQPTAGFFVEEAIRFFNYGIHKKHQQTEKPKKAPGEALVDKPFNPITSKTLDDAIVRYGEAYTEDLYHHIGAIYRGINTGRKKRGGPRNFERLLQNAHNQYVKQAAADKRLKSFLVPRLICDDWATDEGRASTVQFQELHKIYKKTIDKLKKFHQEGCSGIADLLKNVDPENRDAKAFELCSNTNNWVGAGNTLSFYGQNDAALLLWFAPGEEGIQVGLTEKIYATMTLMYTGLSGAGSESSEDTAGTLSTETRRLVEAYKKEIAKLHTNPFGGKKERNLQLDRWLENLSDIEEIVLFLLRHYTSVPLLYTTKDLYGPIRSDLLWAVALIGYLRLFLLRTQMLAFIAAIPFRQIYEGGPITLSSRRRTVPGVVGLIGVSLWEYFSGYSHSHVFFDSARNFLPPKSGFREGWVDPDAPLRDRGLKTRKTALKFSDGLQFLSGDAPVDSDIKRIISTVKLPMKGTGKEPRPFQRIAAVNSGRWPSKRERQESQSEYISRLNKVLASFSQFPPTGKFPVPLEVNPPFLDSFFTLPNANAPKSLRVFNKWGVGSDSSYSFGAKPSVQLQTYVVAWLYQRGIQESGILDIYPDLTAEIKFTAANLQYGGKFPPHKTHRDGYGFDWSLYGVPGQEWHWSIHWPRDNQQPEANTEDRYAQRLLGEQQALTDLASEMRFYLQQALVVPSVPSHLPKEERKAAIARREAELAKAKATVRDVLMRIVPNYQEDFKDKIKITAIPTDALIAQSIDEYNRQSIETTATHEYLFREFVRTALANTLRSTEEKLRQEKPPSIEELNHHFSDLEKEYAGFPVFPTESSHIAHHVAHLAVVLSLPAEIVWGAPIYHFRALRAITSTLAEVSVVTPFTSHPDSWMQKPSKESYPRPVSTTKAWPLPLPRLYFLPHDHHHHWHLQYWKRGLVDSWTRNKILSPIIKSHYDYVCAATPFWQMIGIDFKPFTEYLSSYIDLLPSSQRRIRDEVDSLRAVLEDIGEPHINATVLRSAMFRKVLEYEKENPLAYKHKTSTTTTADWPPKDNLLSDLIKKSTTIATSLRREHAKIKPEALPKDIVEALSAPPEEKEQIRESRNDDLIANEHETTDEGYVDMPDHGEISGDYVARDEEGSVIKPTDTDTQ